ncbi:MAG: serine hydrolase [Chloroflexi bacterium]|nr:serine hydrolase [Chloroflexota bacterium]
MAGSVSRLDADVAPSGWLSERSPAPTYRRPDRHGAYWHGTLSQKRVRRARRGRLLPVGLLAAVLAAIILWPMFRPPDAPSPAVAGGPAPAAVRASASPNMVSPSPSSARPIDPAVGEQAAGILREAGGTAALVLQLPGQAPFATLNDTQVLPSASLYKLGVMAAVYQAVSKGSLNLDQKLTITQDEVDFYGDAPATPAGTTLTVREAMTRMITVSDNSAAGALIDLIGFDAVNSAFAQNGMPHSHLGNPSDADPAHGLAETTAADQAAFYERLLSGAVGDRADSEDMLALLEGQQENDRLPALLPQGTVVAHKTGEIDGVRNDSGIIFTPNGPVICAVLVSDQPAIGQVLDAIARVGLLAYDTAAGQPFHQP